MQMQSIYDSLLRLTDKFCQEYLNEEYAQLSRELTGALCRKRPSPLLRGKANIWACGIIYALGYVNFLFDRDQEPFVNADQLCDAFGVSKSTAYNKSKIIRDMFKMRQFDPNWWLPSLIDENPLVWIIEVDGILVDARWVPREIQEIAFQKGLIPYMPAGRVNTEIDSIVVDDDIELGEESQRLESREKKRKRRQKREDSSQQLFDF